MMKRRRLADLREETRAVARGERKVSARRLDADVVEDDFAEKLRALEGGIGRDVDLEF